MPTPFIRVPTICCVSGVTVCGISVFTSGDLLAVHRTRHVENGQVVVARVDDEVTVKRFRQRGSIVRLMPENPAYEPIRIDLREQVAGH